MSGCAAGCVAAVAVNPVDVVKTRLQVSQQIVSIPDCRSVNKLLLFQIVVVIDKLLIYSFYGCRVSVQCAMTVLNNGYYVLPIGGCKHAYLNRIYFSVNTKH